MIGSYKHMLKLPIDLSLRKKHSVFVYRDFFIIIFTALQCCISNLMNAKSEGFEVNILLTVDALLPITMQVNYNCLNRH